MSNFNKHTWVTGELVTAALLNRIEDAIDTLFNNSMEYATDADCDELISEFTFEDE